MSVPPAHRIGRRITNTDLPDELLKPISAEHLAKDLFWVLESPSGLGHSSTILLAKLIVFVSKLGVGKDLIGDSNLLELEVRTVFETGSHADLPSPLHLDHHDFCLGAAIGQIKGTGIQETWTNLDSKTPISLLDLFCGTLALET